jgi:hypothetical protein
VEKLGLLGQKNGPSVLIQVQRFVDWWGFVEGIGFPAFFSCGDCNSFVLS